MGANQTHRTSYLWPAGIFLGCAFLIGAAGYAIFTNSYTNAIKDTNRTLVSVGELKSNQIQSYLLERRQDAAVVSRFLMTPQAQAWLARRDVNAPLMLNQLAESIGAAYRYKGLLLLDEKANVRLGAGSSELLTEEGRSAALRAMRERLPVSFKIYFGDSSEEPVLDTFVPVMNSEGKALIGAIVLRSELKFLFDLLQTWPVESRSAETLLFARDGGEVLFLNELRNRKGAAAKLRIPFDASASSHAQPVTMAVAGHTGLVEGNDYRGKRVLAYTIAIPDTPWGMAVKIDLEEAVANSYRLLRIAIIVATVFVAFTGGIVWLWWRKEKADELANAQLRESEVRYRRLHESMMDAYVMVDMSGRILESNQAFREMLGYSVDELQQLAYNDLMPEKWREYEARIIEEQVIPDGFSQLFERECLRKGGAAFPAELKYFLLRDAGGKPEAMWAIVRDITERKASEQRMRELTSHLQIAREEEKANIAREIHDDLGGTLTALKMEAFWLADKLSRSENSKPLRKHAELISQLSENAVNVTRRVITGLRPAILDDLGLLAALEWQAEQFHKHTGIACRVNSIGDKAILDKQRSTALFRIFQETLTNVARHSGASKVEVEYHCSDDEVMLSVSDDGRGLPDGYSVSPDSFGVRGMKERVEQFGGQISFGNNPTGGVSVTVTLPLHIDRRKDARAQTSTN